jgi:hypothetical protein
VENQDSFNPDDPDTELAKKLDFIQYPNQKPDNMVGPGTCTLAQASWCFGIDGFQKLEKKEQYKTANDINTRIAKILESPKGISPEIEEIRAKTYMATVHKKKSDKQVQKDKEEAEAAGKEPPPQTMSMVAELHPFNAPSSGALIVSSMVDKDGTFHGNNKPPPAVNQQLNEYALKTIKDNEKIGNGKVENIKDDWVRVNEVEGLRKNKLRTEQQAEAKARFENKEIAETSAESTQASEVDEKDKKKTKKPQKYQKNWKPRPLPEQRWTAQHNNLHAEDLVAANGGRTHSKSDGTPGRVNKNKMFTEASIYQPEDAAQLTLSRLKAMTPVS